ncbi:MAG: hypothetical protein RXP30_06855 [Thermoplasmata archaeon]|jgi:hypothetical protein|nr:hypothetical protein [Euryarchaeota archaeon]MVT36248.1 hypothetical protein [Euryarchaeota archaeon]
MKTYLKVTFNSEGSKPSEIVSALEGLGFRPITGWYDFVYDWGNNATVEDAIWFADKIYETLHGMKVYFQIETTESKENEERE